MHGRREEADVLRELAADRLDAAQELAVLAGVDQRDEPIADLEAEGVDRLQVFLLASALASGGAGGGLGAFFSRCWCSRSSQAP